MARKTKIAELAGAITFYATIIAYVYVAIELMASSEKIDGVDRLTKETWMNEIAEKEFNCTVFYFAEQLISSVYNCTTHNATYVDLVRQAVNANITKAYAGHYDKRMWIGGVMLALGICGAPVAGAVAGSIVGGSVYVLLCLLQGILILGKEAIEAGFSALNELSPRVRIRQFGNSTAVTLQQLKDILIENATNAAESISQTSTHATNTIKKFFTNGRNFNELQEIDVEAGRANDESVSQASTNEPNNNESESSLIAALNLFLPEEENRISRNQNRQFLRNSM